jgi:hypothetical protein
LRQREREKLSDWKNQLLRELRSMSKRKHEDRVVRVKTSENWHPTFPDGTLRASLLWMKPTDQWRVCFWGDDDFGMERDFDSYIDALEVFRKTTSQKDVTASYLDTMGFRNA